MQWAPRGAPSRFRHPAPRYLIAAHGRNLGAELGGLRRCIKQHPEDRVGAAVFHIVKIERPAGFDRDRLSMAMETHLKRRQSTSSTAKRNLTGRALPFFWRVSDPYQSCVDESMKRGSCNFVQYRMRTGTVFCAPFPPSFLPIRLEISVPPILQHGHPT